MKTTTKRGTFFAVALGAALLLGQAIPAQAQALTSTQPQASQSAPASAGWHGGGHGGGHGPMGGGCGW